MNVTKSVEIEIKRSLCMYRNPHMQYIFKNLFIRSPFTVMFPKNFKQQYVVMMAELGKKLEICRFCKSLHVSQHFISPTIFVSNEQ